jgi:hypothetical protein
MARPDLKCRRQGGIIFDRVEKLEPIVSALGRDSSNPRNNALRDIFSEHISECKKELKSVQEDIFPE